MTISRKNCRLFQKSALSVEDEAVYDRVKVTVKGDVVTVSLEENMQIALYAIDGKQVANVSGAAGQNDIRVPSAGIYVLQAGDATFKLLAQ